MDGLIDVLLQLSTTSRSDLHRTRLDLTAIARDELGLLGQLEDGLRGIRGVTVYAGPLGRRVATLSITVSGWDPSDVGTILDVDYGVPTRTGLQCAPKMHEHLGTTPAGTVRFSIGPFNTAEHIATAVRSVAEIAARRA